MALHNAHVIAELETFRRVEVDAARDEKRFALGLLGAEITHEIAYPLNFLRYLLGQGSAGRTLDASDVEIGQEEIGRLERMFSTLNKLRIPLPRLQPVLVLPRARRACDLIRETLIAKEIDVIVDVPSDLTVVAEPDPLVQIFANLLRNAAQAVERGRPIGIVARHDVNRIAIEVWDSGPGVPAELQNQIFNPFVTSKEGSMGLGLAVTERLVRSFGWTIGVGRRTAAPFSASMYPATTRVRCATRGPREDPGRRRPGERTAYWSASSRASRTSRCARPTAWRERGRPSPPSASMSRSSTCASQRPARPRRAHAGEEIREKTTALPIIVTASHEMAEIRWPCGSRPTTS